MIVLVVDNNRYLINDESPISDKVCEDIIAHYPENAIVEFDEVRKSDVL